MYFWLSLSSIERSCLFKADIEYSKAQESLRKAIDCENGWEEKVIILENNLKIFQGDTEEAKTIRQHIMHCKHKETTFEEFLFLTMGPLEYGVFHNWRDRGKIGERNTNESRNTNRRELKQAIEMIVFFPEFENWRVNKNGPIVGLKFVQAILGENCFNQGSKPTGYLKALYRIRMFYKEWTEKNVKKGVTIRLEGPHLDSVLKNISHSKWVHFLSQEFKNNVEQKLKSLPHLDFWVDGQKRTGKATEQSDEAVIEQKDIDEKTKVFLFRNALSPEFVSELRTEMNQKPFMGYSEVDEGSHIEGRRIRIASEAYSEFLVGKLHATKRYASVAMAQSEKKLLKSMNVVLQLYGELFEKVLGIKVRQADQLQIVKDSLQKKGYSGHNDQSGLCCLCDSEKRKEGEYDIDAPEFMLVATYVLSSTGLKTTKGLKNTTVTWYKEEELSQKNQCSVTTGDNDIHLQGIYCQTSYKHKVVPIAKARRESRKQDYRLVFSARATMHFQDDDDMRIKRTRRHCFGINEEDVEKELPYVRDSYKYINVLGSGNMGEMQIEPNSSNVEGLKKRKNNEEETGEKKTPGKRLKTVKPQGKSEKDVRNGRKGEAKEKLGNTSKRNVYVKSIILQEDTYPNAPHDPSDPVAQNNPVIIDEPFYKLGTSQPFYERQLAEKVYYEVMVGKTQCTAKHFGPYLVDGKELPIGDLVDTSTVEDFLGIPRGSKEGSLCWSSNNVNGILIKHAYKNDVMSLKKIIAERKKGPFWVGLTGGNPEIRGQTVVKASKATTNCESGYFPKLQSLNKHNVSLMEAAMGNLTVTVFMQVPGKSNQSYYLGCYYLDGFSTHKESIENLRSIAAECSDYISDRDGLFTRFQERTHVRIAVKPYNVEEERQDTIWKKIRIHESDILPIGAGVEQHVDPLSILQLTGNKSVSFDNACRSFLEKGSWRDLIERDHIEDDDVTGENDQKDRSIIAGKAIRVEKEELLRLMVCIAVAVFCRLQHLNVVQDKVTPLRNDISWYKHLGSVIQTYSLPHPGRVYDLTPLMLILSSASQENGRNERMGVNWMRENPQKSQELIFAAIVATTTGRMGAFYQWTNYQKVTNPGIQGRAKEKGQIGFPKPAELADFIHFLGKATKNGKMGPFISGQYRSSLPMCVHTVANYSAFLSHVVGSLEDFYNRMIQKMEETSCSKEDLQILMVAYLSNKIIDGGKPNFVASQIIYNLDEMINLLPGKDWDNIEMGYGSKEAIDWLVEGGKDEKMTYLKILLKYVKQLDHTQLVCLGLKNLEPRGKKIVWAVNNRALGLHDMEHFICKLWCVMIKVVGARPSKNPKLHRPHLHPLRLEDSNITQMYGEYVLKIARDASNMFRKAVEKKTTRETVCIPQSFNNW